VSVVEYVVAYTIPIAIGALLVRPHEKELRLVVEFLSICNLLIRTPRLEALSKNLWPIFVTTHDHIMEHHKRLPTTYAPLNLNFDWIVEQIQVVFQKNK
jgi:hypothetical protein